MTRNVDEQRTQVKDSDDKNSQNKIGVDGFIVSIDIIVKKNPSRAPIINKEISPLINEINKLESEYFNLKAIALHNGFEYEFYRIEGNFKRKHQKMMMPFLNPIILI